MYADEAEVNIKPRSSVKKVKSVRKIARKYSIIINALFVFVILLCIGNYITCKSYSTMKKQINEMNSKVSTANTDNQALISKYEDLQKQNEEIRQTCETLTLQNSEIQKQIEATNKENIELERKNKELIDDNIALQNSLKMAASVGIKPQSYTKYSGLASRSELDRGTYIGKFLGTAYTPSKEECGNNKGLTNSGKPIIPGISIAIDSKYWPFGTVFYIKGLGYAVAMDTGNGINGKNRFDFAVFDRNFALMLGERYWDVYLIRMGNGTVGDIRL